MFVVFSGSWVVRKVYQCITHALFSPPLRSVAVRSLPHPGQRPHYSSPWLAAARPAALSPVPNARPLTSGAHSTLRCAAQAQNHPRAVADVERTLCAHDAADRLRSARGGGFDQRRLFLFRAREHSTGGGLGSIPASGRCQVEWTVPGGFCRWSPISVIRTRGRGCLLCARIRRGAAGRWGASLLTGVAFERVYGE